MILKNPKERTRFLRFTVVGTIGAVVDFGTFNLMIGVFKILPVISNIISFSVAVVSNFIWNRYWTYPDSRTKPIRKQLLEFFIVNAVGVLIRTPIFAVLEKPLVAFFQGFSFPLPFSPEFMGHNFALGVAMVVVLFWNFFINRFWTYADVSDEAV